MIKFNLLYNCQIRLKKKKIVRLKYHYLECYDSKLVVLKPQYYNGIVILTIVVFILMFSLFIYIYRSVPRRNFRGCQFPEYLPLYWVSMFLMSQQSLNILVN